MPTPPLLPPPTDDPATLAEQALALRAHNPQQAMTLFRAAIKGFLATGQRREAALALHRRAALAVATGASPVADLAHAARLLHTDPAARALVLLDLGHALHQEGDLRRATLVLRESEKVARQLRHEELITASRHALAKVAEASGHRTDARHFLRHTGQTMIYEAEGELLATLRDMGNLPTDALPERARRQQAVEEELARLKQEMGLA